VQEHVPIWVGGRTPRSLRRALELGDAWCPFGLTLDHLQPMLDTHRESIAERGSDFEVVLAPEPPVDPSGDPERAMAIVHRYTDAGATSLNLRFASTSLQHYLEQLEAMQAIIAEIDA
jgi:alkanesulfonate monooxygenase SsuD/methylene tetrahydromethanopterin reductase-like flavin-dependent oxidoreductase (luciferase family)